MTSVEWLVEKLSKYNEEMVYLYTQEIRQAKEMDKEQKIDFANEYAQAVMGGCLLNPTEFYNETFKQQEQ